MSCPRSDAKRPGAAPKALGVCFSDFFGVGNLLGCRLHRGPEARTDRRGWTGAGKLRAALGIVGSRNWSEFPRREVVGTFVVAGCATNGGSGRQRTDPGQRSDPATGDVGRPPPTALLISTTLNCACTVRCCARVSVWRSGLTECCQEMLCGAVRTGFARINGGFDHRSTPSAHHHNATHTVAWLWCAPGVCAGHRYALLLGKEGYCVRRRGQQGGLGVGFWGQTCGKTYGSLSIKNKSEHGFQSNAISVIVDSACISLSVTILSFQP